MHMPHFVRWLALLSLVLLLGPFRAQASALADSVNPLITAVQASSDPFSAPTIGAHHTEVETDTFSHGSEIVAGTQEGRDFFGGSASVGWATSLNGGDAFSHGSLPGITTQDNPPGPYQRDTDPSVSYDAKFGTWLINTLPLTTNSVGAAILVSSSSNGTTWNNPTTVATATGGSSFDKNWIVCDNTSSSPFYGNCYVEYDDNGLGNILEMSTSTDGGNTWGPSIRPAGQPSGIGGQPVVQPNGTVVVPIDNAFEGSVLSYTSTNGGASWTAPVTISPISYHGESGNLRSGPLPSAEVDGAGKVYVVWGDCRFESGCTANDIVMSTSTNGTTWSTVTRIPIAAVGSGQDTFIPGISVDVATSGSTAHLGLIYYYYPQTNCTSSTCRLEIGFISSTNGGATWSRAQEPLGSPMQLSWLAPTDQGQMVGDYTSTSFVNGQSVPVVAYAVAPSGSVLNEAMYSGRFTVSGGDTAGTVWDGHSGLVPAPGYGVPRTAR